VKDVNSASLKDYLPVLKGFLLIIIIAAGWSLLKFTSWGETLQDYEWVRLKISQSTYFGTLVFVLVGGLLTVIGFPRIALSALGGFIYGFIFGCIWGILGTMVGCVLSYYYAKHMGREFVEKKIPEKYKKYDAFLKDYSFSMTLAIRLFPIGNNMVTNLLAGVSSVVPYRYFLATFIGYIPQTLIFSLLGSGIRKETWLRITLSAGLFILSVLIMMFLRKRLKDSLKLPVTEY
jgi:uncharacterized membrane protein YdjX (TVP38/TMEM64 family)